MVFTLALQVGLDASAAGPEDRTIEMGRHVRFGSNRRTEGSSCAPHTGPWVTGGQAVYRVPVKAAWNAIRSAKSTSPSSSRSASAQPTSTGTRAPEKQRTKLK